jgi:ribonuclease Z
MSEIRKFQEIEVCDYNNLKVGRDFTLTSGETIQNSLLTQDPKKPMSYAYCSDTSYKPDIVEIIKKSDLLYHESTFLSDKEDLATKTRHSTAKQAALIAKKADVKKLILGHYSSRYKDITLFKKEAEEVFSNVILAETGKTVSM